MSGVLVMNVAILSVNKGVAHVAHQPWCWYVDGAGRCTFCLNVFKPPFEKSDLGTIPALILHILSLMTLRAVGAVQTVPNRWSHVVLGVRQKYFRSVCRIHLAYCVTWFGHG